MSTQKANVASREKSRFTKTVQLERPRLADKSPLLVLTGLVVRDGSAELAFCSEKGGANNSFLFDRSDAWDPDGDGDLVAACPKCERTHRIVPFAAFVLERDFDFEDNIIMIGADKLLAETVINLRAKAVAR